MFDSEESLCQVLSSHIHVTPVLVFDSEESLCQVLFSHIHVTPVLDFYNAQQIVSFSVCTLCMFKFFLVTLCAM